MNGKHRLFRKGVRCKFLKHFYSNIGTNRLLDVLANMPKNNTARVAEVQKQRLKLSKKNEKYGSSTIYLQVLGSGARGAPNTLYLFTDQKRYLFNCGECTQRLAHEHKVKLSRLDHIFITSKTWKNLGGLPGLSLTLQDVGVPNITLHGPEGLDELYNATKRFVIMKELNVTMAKCDPTEDFDDNVMSVKYILLGPNHLLHSDMKPSAKKPKLEAKEPDQEFDEFIHDDTDYYRHKPHGNNTSKNMNLKLKVKSPFERDAARKKTERQNYIMTPATYTVAYICTLKKRLGTLDLEKCVELGVKPGPLLGQLKSGQDVVLPDGKLVLSKDVKIPDDPGPVFIVLEVPEISYLKEDEFAAHFDDGTNPQENIPVVVVHYTPPNVFHHPSYQAFMQMFGPTTRHLILNAKNSCLGSEAVHRTQHKLHLLDPDIFPLLKDLSVPAVWNAHPPLPKTSSPIRLKGLEELKNKIALAQFQTIINMDSAAQGEGEPPADPGKLELLAARTLTMFHLRPKRQLDRSAEPKLHIQDYIQETMDVDGFVPSLEQFRRLVDGMRYAKTDAREYPKVVFLGTGSCIPSKTRNTSAIVLQIDEHRSMLLDCGEGTFGQLVRFYGPKRVNSFLRTLKAIYISHLHADHHIGLIGVLQARREALLEAGQDDPPLLLLAPGQIVTWLAKYDQQFEAIRSEFTLVPNQNLLESKANANTEVPNAAISAAGVERLVTCMVSHCPNAFGVAVQVDQTHKITYSGDTIPCEELVKIGQNSTLLIHEATMEDELAEEARTKMHSTTSQAIEMGKRMNARFTVLTHFSQRYARLPRLNAHILNDNKSVGIAFDNMQITMSDLDLLPHMYAPLQLMFAEHCVELELKAAHRARVKEKQISAPALPASGTNKNQSSTKEQPLALQLKVKYKDSNPSKLRQASKGVLFAGVVNSLRSKSCSPGKRHPRASLSSTPGSESEPQSPDRAGSLTPRSASVPGKEKKGSSGRVTPNLSPKPTEGCLVRTRSKTSDGSGNHKLQENEDSKRGRNTPKSNDSQSALSSAGTESPRGYGKPLVTPMHRKLTIRRVSRDNTIPPDTQYNPLNRSRSPIKSWKAENKQTPPPSPRRPISGSKLPVKTSGRDKVRSPGALRPEVPVRNAPAIAANRSVRQPSISPTSRSGSTPARKANIDRGQRDTMQNRPDFNTNIFAQNTSFSTDKNSKLKSRPHSTVSREGIAPAVGPGSVKSTSPSRESLRSLTAQRSNMAKESRAFNKRASTFSNQSSKSFKPQLEDIKSSYLLLNKKTLNQKCSQKSNDSAVTLTESAISIDIIEDCLRPWRPGYYPLSSTSMPRLDIRDEANVPSVSKPRPISEEERRRLLIEAKSKFKTKRFWNDEKYNKIEGLNWISWK